MEILLLLYLAHYLGDYPFQTGWVYAQKLKSWSGGLFHSLGLTLALIVCLAPYLNHWETWLTIFLIVFMHYFQDAGKLIFNKAFEREVVGYFIDQFMHLVFSTFFWFILIANKSFDPMFGSDYYGNSYLIAFLIGLLFATYILEVTLFVIANADQDMKLKYRRDWEMMFINGVTYSGIWLFFWLVFVA